MEKKQLLWEYANRTRCGGERQVTVERALEWAYDSGHDAGSGVVPSPAPSAADELRWFRDVIAEEMSVDAPAGDAVHPLREWLRRLKLLETCDQDPQRLLTLLKMSGGNLRELAEAGLVAVKKGEDYNTGFGRDDYFPLGLASYAQMLWVKALRIVSFAKQPRQPNSEAVLDTLLDMINYASFGADWLRRQQPKSCSTRADCGVSPKKEG